VNPRTIQSHASSAVRTRFIQTGLL
jgi:hypothetical protein